MQIDSFNTSARHVSGMSTATKIVVGTVGITAFLAVALVFNAYLLA